MNKYLQENQGGLLWGPLIRGILVRRYKRFLADVRLGNNHVVTAHCPNTGSMLSCSEPGWPVFISRHNNPQRRLKYTWDIIEAPNSLVGVNTSVPNKLVKAAVTDGRIPVLSGYSRVLSEVKTGPRTRLDLMLEGGGAPNCYIEIKNCTLVENERAFFPDAVTERGRKHLGELINLVKNGSRGVIFFLIQRMDAAVFSPADHIDPEYGRVLRRAVDSGVEALAYDVTINPERIDLNRSIKVDLGGE